MPQARLSVIPIAAAEQETGLSKDVLRAWERRYGFPAPLRDADGDRLYPLAQIRRLRLLRQLTDLGERPGKLVALADAQLAERIAKHASHAAKDSATKPSAAIADCMVLVAQSAAAKLEMRLNAEIIRLGLERFAKNIAAPLCVETGLAWERGDIGVHHEHLFSQILARSLRQAIERVGPGTRNADPPILLTTAPGEIHELGLLMVEAVLCANGLARLNFGPQMPVDEVVSAAQAHGCRVVALSFSSWFDPKRASTIIADLRQRLPAPCRLWVGGSNPALRLKLPTGIDVFTSLDQIVPALSALTKPSAASTFGNYSGMS